MCPKPLFRALGATVRQQIDHLAVFQVAEDRSIAMPLSNPRSNDRFLGTPDLAPSPIIDPQHPRHLGLIHYRPVTQLPQQSRAVG
jgi:hypothetical protein